MPALDFFSKRSHGVGIYVGMSGVVPTLISEMKMAKRVRGRDLLTDLQVSKAKPSRKALAVAECDAAGRPIKGKITRYADGDGLYLEVTVVNRKRWLLRVQRDGRRHDLGLGKYPDVSLKAARAKRDQIRSKVAVEGIDPLSAHRRMSDGVPTLIEAATEVYEALLRDGKFRKGATSKAAIRWISSMHNHVPKAVQSKPVSQIVSADIAAIIDAAKHKDLKDVPRDLRNRLNVVMMWARQRGYLDHNPCEIIKVPKNGARTQHYRSLPFNEIGAFVRQLRQSDRSLPTIRLALEMTLLTGGRSQEARFAKWNEIDWNKQIWTVPPDNMKSGDFHQIPLSGSALRILDAAKSLRRDDGLIFPGQAYSKSLSENTLNARIKQMGYGDRAVTHGFRATFRTWASECTDFPRELCELVLDHDIGTDVERSYRRGQQTERRRPIMEAWASFIEQAVQDENRTTPA